VLKQDRKAAENKKKTVSKVGIKEEGRCRYCLAARMTIKALAKHVKEKHPDHYVRGNSPKDYVAREGQTKAEDPQCEKTTLEI
jgi:hypothetical protein